MAGMVGEILVGMVELRELALGNGVIRKVMKGTYLMKLSALVKYVTALALCVVSKWRVSKREVFETVKSCEVVPRVCVITKQKLSVQKRLLRDCESKW